MLYMWPGSSVGRALACRARCRQFDPGLGHHYFAKDKPRFLSRGLSHPSKVSLQASRARLREYFYLISSIQKARRNAVKPAWATIWCFKPRISSKIAPLRREGPEAKPKQHHFFASSFFFLAASARRFLTDSSTFPAPASTVYCTVADTTGRSSLICASSETR